MRTLLTVFVVSLLSALEAAGQSTPACRVLCAPEFKVEPTITFTNLFGSPRIVDEQGTTTREPRGTEFEVILSSVCRRARRGWSSLSRRFSCRSTGRARRSWSSRPTSFGFLQNARAVGSASHFDIVDKFSRRQKRRQIVVHTRTS